MLVPGLTITGGQVSTTASSGQVADFISGGIGFVSDGSLALDTGTPTGSTMEAGLLLNSTGAIFATTTLSAGDVWLSGIRRATNGALVIEKGAQTQVVNGNPLTTNGVLAVTSAGASGDPYFANVQALLHFDGVDGGTVFTDVIGHTFSVGGTATRTTSTSSPKWGTASLLGTAADSGYVVNSSTTTDFATDGAYTIECWAVPSTLASNGMIFGVLSGGGAVSCALYHAFTTGALTFYDTSGHALGYNLTANGVYRHLAISSQGAGLPIKAFVDGVTVYTGTAVAGSASNSIYIGFNATLGISGMKGYTDDFRFTKGICRYTADFTPPTGPFPDSL